MTASRCVRQQQVEARAGSASSTAPPTGGVLSAGWRPAARALGGRRGEPAEAKWDGTGRRPPWPRCAGSPIRDGVSEPATSKRPWRSVAHPAVFLRLHSQHALEPLVARRRRRASTRELRVAPTGSAPGNHPQCDEPWIDHAHIVHGYLISCAFTARRVCLISQLNPFDHGVGPTNSGSLRIAH